MTYNTKTQMDRRWRRLELFGRLSVLNHADDVPCHYSSLLGAGSGGLVRSGVGDVTERVNVGELLALELQCGLYEDAAVGRVYERYAR